MSIRDKIFDSELMKSLMKSKEKEKLSTLKFLKSEIQRNEDSSKKMDDQKITNLLKKSVTNLEEVKSDGWEKEVEFITQFIPKQLSEEEIKKELTEVFDSFDSEKLNIGFIMGTFNKKYPGSVDNKLLSKLIKEKL